MTVEYFLEITAKCPSDDSADDVYDCWITSRKTLPVESILKVVEELTAEPLYQEDLGVSLAASLGAEVTLVGVHYGIRTTTWAGR